MYVWRANNYIDNDDPYSGILAATAFALWSMYHTTLQAMSGQLVLGHEMILNNPFITEWEVIRRRYKQIIDKKLGLKKP